MISKNWFKNIMLNKNDTRESLNSRVKKRHKKWHSEIRTLLELPLDFQNEISCDFDVLFDFWEIPKKDLANVFSEVNGIEEIMDEIIAFKKSKILKNKEFVDFKELAVSNIRKTIDRLSDHIDTSSLYKIPIKIENGDFHTDYKKVGFLIDITESYSDILYDEILQKGNELKYSLALFLSEPIYRLSTSYFPVHYFQWKLIGQNDNLNPYKYLFELLKDYGSDVFICEEEIKIYTNNYFE
ncbi:hypothetical protein [Flavivirga algicola]|uniref:Barstar (barnase inhibitor) domain-containing protein n=1 Tax=Flavivirga algicola TaxID=2729136 RepID=A0ABX1S165_9FLAO|nr:hypothetical protein [Flavivirga algicola]NMH89622.1 hypothetical protein [Flavivirga algicola]